ncbi:MAG: LamG-like jellyroll fold domain-containing protein [Bacteroidia bacterium]
MKKIYLFILLLGITFSVANAQISLGSGLSASYPFTGNANDDSGSGLNGTVVGATLTTDRFGNPNCAYFYNGSSDYVDFGNVLNTAFSGVGNKFSISVWIKPYATAAASGILTKDADGACSSAQQQFALSVYGGKIMLLYSSSLGTGNAVYAQGSTSVTDTSMWYHVVAMYDGTNGTAGGLGRVQMYVNNVMQTISAALPPSGTLGNMQAGTAHLGTATTLTSSGTLCAASSYDFHGKIDDIRIYDRLLNAAEINAIYLGPTNVGISEPGTLTNFNIYPNPSSGVFGIKVNDTQATGFDVLIYDILGNQVGWKHSENKESMIDLSAQPAGVYFVTVNTGNESGTHKIILVK